MVAVVKKQQLKVSKIDNLNPENERKDLVQFIFEA